MGNRDLEWLGETWSGQTRPGVVGRDLEWLRETKKDFEWSRETKNACLRVKNNYKIIYV